jgi:hypothetical protein
MSDPLDVFERLPWELQACLEGDDFFSDIPVLVYEEENVRMAIERLQAVQTLKGGKRGAAVIILPMLADDLKPNLRFGPMTLYPSFQTLENVELNRQATGTGKSSRRIARRCRDTVKQYQLPGLVVDLRPETPCISALNLKQELGDGVKSHLVRFTCLEAPFQGPAFVKEVAGTINAGLITLSCPTAGAAIWVTADGSSPLPTNVRKTSTAKLYTAPFAAAAGQLTRARAFVPGAIPSGVFALQT